MTFLKILEQLRFEPLTSLMRLITFLGSESFFIVIALVVFWCLDKRRAYYLFATGFIGIGLCQFMKLWFRIPRPWILDPAFTIVEAARAGAGGYSFPSGHSQSVVVSLGSIAVFTKNKTVKRLCLAMMVLVPFSRMYLGVHTPLDVFIGVLISASLLWIFYPLFESDESWHRNAGLIFIAISLFTLLYALFVWRYEFPADLDAENFASGVKAASTMIGCFAGLMLTYIADRKRDFSVKATLPGQFLKVGLGLLLLLPVKSLLKAPLTSLLGACMGDIIRYFIMVTLAGCVWPLTFRYFEKIGKKD